MGKQFDKTESNLPESSGMPSAESRFHLVWNVEGLERIFPLREGENRVGSLSSNDLVLLDLGISRRHALLTVRSNKVCLTDLGSKNGTLVNGAYADSVNLAAGDEIVFGNVALRLQEGIDASGMAFLMERPARAGRRTERDSALTASVRRQPLFGETLRFPQGHVEGSSAAALEMYHQLATACRGNFPVLLLGETGVGKEDVARTLHLSSRRRKGPFLAVHCAAIPADLLEADLFGVARGVATGVAERRGRFQQAEGGTLFLDEIGDMALDLQVKLLRVLEAGEVQPVGGRNTAIDVRIVAATNVDLQERLDKGLFRRDLYYRLAGYVLEIPTLRARRDDVAGLVEHFIRESVAESGRYVRGVTQRTIKALTAYDWPGNVRELAHETRRLVYSCHDGEAIDLPLLSEPIRRVEQTEVAEETEHPEQATLPEEPGGGFNLARQTAALEQRLIRDALRQTGGHRSRAAALLGISRQGLRLKIERLGITDWRRGR